MNDASEKKFLCHLAETGLNQGFCQYNSSPEECVVEPFISNKWEWVVYLNGDEFKFCSLRCTERFFSLIGFEVLSETFNSEKQRARVLVKKYEKKNGGP